MDKRSLLIYIQWQVLGLPKLLRVFFGERGHDFKIEKSVPKTLNCVEMWDTNYLTTKIMCGNMFCNVLTEMFTGTMNKYEIQEKFETKMT